MIDKKEEPHNLILNVGQNFDESIIKTFFQDIHNISKNQNSELLKTNNIFVVINNNENKMNELNQKIDLLLDKVSLLENKDKKFPKNKKKVDWSVIEQLRESLKDEPPAEELIKMIIK